VPRKEPTQPWLRKSLRSNEQPGRSAESGSNDRVALTAVVEQSILLLCHHSSGSDRTSAARPSQVISVFGKPWLVEVGDGMTRCGWLLMVALLLQDVVAAAPAQECRPDAVDVREIRAVAIGIVAADKQRDIERVLAFYTADAVLMPPGEAPVVGRDRIRPRYEALFATFTPEILGQIEESCVGSGVGFVRGRNGGRLIPRAPGDARVLDDAYLMLLRLEAEGVWRISHLMWHRQSEPAPTPVSE